MSEWDTLDALRYLERTREEASRISLPFYTEPENPAIWIRLYEMGQMIAEPEPKKEKPFDFYAEIAAHELSKILGEI